MISHKLYAAYSRNTNIKQMSYLAKNAFIVGKGYIEDFELEFKFLANIKKRLGAKVPIVLWAISAGDERRLDVIECARDGLVRKEIVKVKLEEMTEEARNMIERNNLDGVDAMVYVMEDDSKPVSPPMLAYYNLIFEGYQQNGLDVTVLVTAAIKAGSESQELMKVVKCDGFSEEEMQILVSNLFAKWLLKQSR